MAMLPARSLMTLACLPRGTVALAEFVATLKVVICHSFARKPAGMADRAGRTRVGCRHECHACGG